MLELKEAVTRSLAVLKETFAVPETAEVELEEAQLQDEPGQWLLTFSYPDLSTLDVPDTFGPNLRSILKKRRAYKEIKLRALDGTVMGVRNLHL